MATGTEGIILHLWKFCEIVDSRFKFLKNPRWPLEPGRPFCTIGFSVSDAKSDTDSLRRILLKLGTLILWVKANSVLLPDFPIFG